MPCVCKRWSCAPCWRCEEAEAFLASADGQALKKQWQLVERRWRAYHKAQETLVALSCQAFGTDADMTPGRDPDATRSWHILKMLGMSNTRIATVWSKVRDAYDTVSAGRGLG
jgi:hypothetical protein